MAGASSIAPSSAAVTVVSGGTNVHRPPPPASGRGITVVSDGTGMRELATVLAAAPCWGFSLALDSDHAPTLSPPALAGMRLPHPAAPVGCDGTGNALTKAPGGVANEALQQWEWSVLGVAFSVADGEAFYVPLTRTLKKGAAGYVPNIAACGADAKRVGTGERLQDLWQGLARVFGSAVSANGGQHDSLLSQARAGAHRVTTVVDAAYKQAAWERAGVSAPPPPCCSPVEWLGAGHGPVAVTYGLKAQLAALADPPAGSGLPGLLIGHEPLLDVRLAAWVLDPDNKRTQEAGTAESGSNRHDTVPCRAIFISYTCAHVCC
jgi:hypothetical protein